MSNIDIGMLRRQLDRIEAASGSAETANTGNGSGAPPSGTWASWWASVDARLSRLEGALEGLKASVDGTRWVIGIVALVMIGGFSFMIGGFGFLGLQLNRLEGRVDRVETAVVAIPAHLSDEFRATRAEMAAQTSAIANSITAVRQAQPPPPQIIIVPSPPAGEKPARP